MPIYLFTVPISIITFSPIDPLLYAPRWPLLHRRATLEGAASADPSISINGLGLL